MGDRAFIRHDNIRLSCLLLSTALRPILRAMTLPQAPALSLPPMLSEQDAATLTELYIRGTPQNTRRAYERDLLYIATWKAVRFGGALDWPEREAVALCFILDHAIDLTQAALDDPARQVAEGLIARGLRRSLACPAPATLDRRIASWRTFHRMRNLPSPFEAPLIAEARRKARRAAARQPAPKSAHPITRDVLETMLESCEPSPRGRRDRAMLMLGFASGGRRRSEIAALMRADVGLEGFAAQGLIRLRLAGTKTTPTGKTPTLVLKGRPARALVDWIEAARIEDGPLFRAISKSGRVLARQMSGDAVYQIVKRRLRLAGLAEDYASPHGLRSGFLTQAALDGAPLQAAMRLSLHKSMAQAQRYYDDVEIAENPAGNLLG